MKTISILNLKGGVAKTFTAANMAYELYRRGYKVLLIDNDKQGNLSKAYSRYDAENVAPVTRLLAGDWENADELIQHTEYEGIDIVTANMSLFGATWNLTKEDSENQIERYKALVYAKMQYYGDCTIYGKYDYCIIDNPPDIGLNVVNALAITDEVIVPVKLDEDEQKEIAEKAAAGENVRAKEIAEKVAEKKAGDDYETPHPESITSLCYSCQKYKDCNVKTGTCQKCDQYINKAEAEKTDEQRYSEEQDAIDRQTKKKLQERADAEKMEHLPSEGNIEHKQHELKIVASDYEDVISGKKSFELRKNDRGYKQGDSLKMLEFKDGKHTGRTIDADIIYMLEDYTGLTEGYCILGIRVTDYTGKVSETDTESGAVNV